MRTPNDHKKLEIDILRFKKLVRRSHERALTDDELDELLHIACYAERYAAIESLTTPEINGLVDDVLRRMSH